MLRVHFDRIHMRVGCRGRETARCVAQCGTQFEHSTWAMRCGQSGQSWSILERVGTTAVSSPVPPSHGLDEFERVVTHGPAFDVQYASTGPIG
jgi:hypothetical protein